MYRKDFQDKKSQRTYRKFVLNLQSNLVFSRGTVILTFNLQNYSPNESNYFDVLVVRYFILMIDDHFIFYIVISLLNFHTY